MPATDGRIDVLLIDAGLIDDDGAAGPASLPPAATAGGYIEVHDPVTYALVDVLENASHIGYEKAVNKSSIGWFTLPRDDPKWSSVQAFREAWMYDATGNLVDIFRIMPLREMDAEAGANAVVNLEGYATVLQDDLVSAEVVWTNATVTQILTDLLGYQTVGRVTLGSIDPGLNLTIGGFRVSYDNVMKACWELRNVVGGYISVDQRALNLRSAPGQDIGQRVTRGWNLRSISKLTDPTEAVTKVYPLGRGEGNNQLRPSTNMLLQQDSTFVFVGAGSRSTLTITDTYSRYKGWTVLGGPLPNGVTANDTRVRPLRVWRDGVDDSANWEQGANERVLRSTTNGYNPSASSWKLDYVHADYLIADDTVATYGTIARPYPEKTLESSLDLIRSARSALDVVKQPRVTYELSVADLARNYPTESFERLSLYDQLNVWDSVLGITTKQRIVQVRYEDIWNPDTFTIVVGNAESIAADVRLQDRARQYATLADGSTNLLGPIPVDENVDATHPYRTQLYIPPESVVVNKLTLSIQMKPYRYDISIIAAQEGAHRHAWSSASLSTDFSAGTNNATTTDAQGVHTHSDPQGGTTGSSVDHSHNVPAESQNTHRHLSLDGASFVTTLDPNGVQAENPTGLGLGHTHAIIVTPGIIETSAASSLQVLVDDTLASASATSLTEFDLTPFLTKDTVGNVVRGWHTVTFAPNGVGRIQGVIVGMVFLQSRGTISG